MQSKPKSCLLCKATRIRANSRPINNSEDALAYLKFFRKEKQEYFVCLSLDSGLRPIARNIVTIGLLDQVIAHPREIFAQPLIDRAALIVIAHNHPAGNPHPSQRDVATTHKLVAAGQLIGIPVWDHIIVAPKSYYSFKDEGWI